MSDFKSDPRGHMMHELFDALAQHKRGNLPETMKALGRAARYQDIMNEQAEPTLADNHG